MTRRVLLAVVAALSLLSACSVGGTGGGPGSLIQPLCNEPSEALVLLAQTVQDATQLPCVTGYPAGWSYGGDDFRKGSGTFWLTSAIAGERAVEVRLLPSCEATGDPIDVPRFAVGEAYAFDTPQGETRRFLFEGGCIEQTITLPAASTDVTLLDEARLTLGFLDRAQLAATLDERFGVTLCGAGADPCEG